jgi:hypothetical protein
VLSRSPRPPVSTRSGSLREANGTGKCSSDYAKIARAPGSGVGPIFAAFAIVQFPENLLCD